MPQFSTLSKGRLSEADQRLQKVFNEVIKHIDCTILVGYRNKKDQTTAFKSGKSKLPFPQSKHNSLPSMAVDVAPVEYTNGKASIDWNDIRRICYFAGFVLATAKAMGINLRWGGDWDSDTELKDNTFNDLIHFELKE
jgi:peptidoglycan L-alanyl-D-glutamate endopeptidase CwlK